MNRNIRLGILVSGSGSSAQALQENIKNGDLTGYEIASIICNKARGEAGIYDREKNLGFEVQFSKKSSEQLEIFKEAEVDVVLGLGYTGMVRKVLLDHYKDRVLNIHPADLFFGGKGMFGLEPHKAVLWANRSFTRPTVHLMNENYDEGKVIDTFDVFIPDHIKGKGLPENAAILQKLVLPKEYYLMLKVLKEARLQVDMNGWDLPRF